MQFRQHWAKNKYHCNHGVKFPKSDRRLKFSIFGRFLEAKSSIFLLFSDSFELEIVSYFQNPNPTFPHVFYTY